MSTHVRTGGGGGRHKKSNAIGKDADQSTHATSGGSKKTDTANKTEKVLRKATEEQLRIASITNSNTHDDPQMREKVVMLQEMTQRSEEEVCCALNECDYDLDEAVNFLLESLPVGAFEKSQKKKRNKAAANVTAAVNEVGNIAATTDGEWVDSNANADKREKSRNRNSNRTAGRGSTDSRGWRGRENRDNERNTRDTRGGDRAGFGGDRGGDDRANENYRGQRSGGGGGRNGPRSGGGYAGRGGRGGRTGGRGPGGRNDRGGYGSRSNTQDDHQEVDLWDNTIAQNAEKQQQSSNDDAWGDWNNEEYEGSLKDSKVFTTSSIHAASGAEVAAPPGLELSSSARNSVSEDAPREPVNSGTSLTVVNTSILQYSAAVSNPPPQLQQQQPVAPVPSPNTLNAATITQNIQSTLVGRQQTAPISQDSATVKTSATLSAEQSQYFNSLSSQNAASASNKVQHQQTQSSVPNYAQAAASSNYSQAPPVQFPASYANMFSSTAANVVIDANSQPQGRRPRAKLPPPSKIPATAVEMPGDNAMNNVGFLDVQFGALDFTADESIVDSLNDKFNTSVNIDAQQQKQTQQQIQQSQQQQQDLTNDYHKPTSGLQTNQMLQGEPLTGTGAYGQRQVTQQQQQQQGVGSSALEQLVKSDSYNQTNVSNTTGYQTAYQSSVANKVQSSSSYQQTPQAYNTSNYPNVQSSTAGNYPAYNTFQPNTYQQQQQTGTVNSQPNIPVGAGSGQSNSSASANATANYLSAAYATQTNAYQTNQTVYGNSSGLSNNAGVSVSGNTSLQNASGVTVNSAAATISSASGNSNTIANNGNATNNSGPNNSTVVSSSAASITGISSSSSNSTTSSAAQTAAAGPSAVFGGLTGKTSVTSTVAISSGTSVNTTSAATGSASGTGAVGGGAAPGGGMVPPNIPVVSQYIQPGVPYYQQPAIYSYEDMQMMQQRMQHVQGFFDVNYPQNSVRDNLAFSTLGDARFARTDNNSSPVSNVSNTMSQPANSGGPMLNVPYYFYGGMPGSFQYSAPIYPQQIPANAPSGGQFPKPSYNPGYGSSNYDSLSQQTQDYSKGAYSSNVNPQNKTPNVANQQPAPSGNDISSSMYGKGHVALNKVNSYDKQSFHAGTPPPFNMPNTQAAGGTSAQQYGMYLPMPTGGHHNMIHTQIHQDSNSTGQRQQTNTQSKAGAKAGYSQSYWPGQN